MAQSARARKNDTSTKYFPVSPLLVLPRARGEFDVYLKQGDKLVLYCKSGERFTESHRAKLADMGVEQVWIRALDHDGYERYVSEYLGDILADEIIPVAQRATVWGDVSIGLLESMLGKDVSEEVFRSGFARLRNVIRSSTKFFTASHALKELAYYLGKGFSSYKHGLTVMVYTGSLLATFDDIATSSVTNVCVGAMLHDIGKARLPAELVNKDPRLFDETDRAALASHPALGVSVCSRLALPQEVLNCILFHHERCDGSGYPSGAKKEELPFYTRVVALTNVYDNLTRCTPFQQGVSSFAALTRIRDEGAGHDVDLLKRFIGVLSSAKIV